MPRKALYLLAVVLAASGVCDEGTGSAERSTVDAVSTVVDGLQVLATVTGNGRDVALSVANEKEPVQLGLPDGGQVSQLRIGLWLDSGIVLAIETHDPQTKEYSYYWATTLTNKQQEHLNRPAVSRFLTSKVDYDLAGVVNTQGDSICITLLRHVRKEGKESIDGYFYLNNCPVGPAIKGTLNPFNVKTSNVTSLGPSD